MTKLKKCGKCGFYGHNARTCKKTDAEAKALKADRVRWAKEAEERRAKESRQLVTALVDGLNALGRVAGVGPYLEDGGPDEGVYLEWEVDLNLDGPEAVAVMVAGIAEKINE